MSSKRYEDLTDGLQTICEDLERGINEQLVHAFGGERKHLVGRIEGQLEEANNQLLELEAEARLAPLAYRHEMLAGVKSYRDIIARLSREYRQRVSDLGVPQGSQRFSSAPVSVSLEDENRQRVLQGKAILERTSDSLARSQRTAVETEQIGIQVVDDLTQQRETLLRTKRRLADTDEGLSESRRILRRMYFKVITNKIILIFIIIIELGILGAVIYLKFFK